MSQIEVGLLIIATGKYDTFLPPLLTSIDRHFFPGEKIAIYLFTSRTYKGFVPKRARVREFWVKHLPFPYPTLYRYKWFTRYAGSISSDVLYYIDADMLIAGEVGAEILPDETGLVAVRHPGFWNGGWGDHGTKPDSLAYIALEERKGYYCGGFQGGSKSHYLTMASELSQIIDKDELSGNIAQWHDESYFNKYLTTHPFKELTPAYCFPEAKWAENLPFEKKIIALDKNHKEIRK